MSTIEYPTKVLKNLLFSPTAISVFTSDGVKAEPPPGPLAIDAGTLHDLLTLKVVAPSDMERTMSFRGQSTTVYYANEAHVPTLIFSQPGSDTATDMVDLTGPAWAFWLLAALSIPNASIKSAAFSSRGMVEDAHSVISKRLPAVLQAIPGFDWDTPIPIVIAATGKAALPVTPRQLTAAAHIRSRQPLPEDIPPAPPSKWVIAAKNNKDQDVESQPLFKFIALAQYKSATTLITSQGWDINDPHLFKGSPLPLTATTTLTQADWLVKEHAANPSIVDDNGQTVSDVVALWPEPRSEVASWLKRNLGKQTPKDVWIRLIVSLSSPTISDVASSLNAALKTDLPIMSADQSHADILAAFATSVYKKNREDKTVTMKYWEVASAAAQALQEKGLCLFSAETNQDTLCVLDVMHASVLMLGSKNKKSYSDYHAFKNRFMDSVNYFSDRPPGVFIEAVRLIAKTPVPGDKLLHLIGNYEEGIGNLSREVPDSFVGHPSVIKKVLSIALNESDPRSDGKIVPLYWLGDHRFLAIVGKALDMPDIVEDAVSAAALITEKLCQAYQCDQLKYSRSEDINTCFEILTKIITSDRYVEISDLLNGPMPDLAIVKESSSPVMDAASDEAEDEADAEADAEADVDSSDKVRSFDSVQDFLWYYADANQKNYNPLALFKSALESFMLKASNQTLPRSNRPARKL